jgi:hypothetical protein
MAEILGVDGRFPIQIWLSPTGSIAKHTKVDMIWVAGRSPTLVSYSLRGVAMNLKATTLTYLAIVSKKSCFWVSALAEKVKVECSNPCKNERTVKRDFFPLKYLPNCDYPVFHFRLFCSIWFAAITAYQGVRGYSCKPACLIGVKS